MTTLIIDYGSGNLRSVAKAFERASEELGCAVRVGADARELRTASRIVLPGVGAFADCMRGLQASPGMVDALHEEVLEKRKPFFGICVGMQMLFTRGREHGAHAGLGWLGGEVVALSPDDASLKIPHMGWNELRLARAHPVLAGIEEGAHAYFVHSYHAKCSDLADMLATVDYGGEICAMVAKENIVGTQFHPEKSQETGLRIIRNFLGL